MTARLRITATIYRRRPGFLISGRDTSNCRISIFAETRESAEYIRSKVKAGQEITFKDFSYGRLAL